MTRSMSTMIQGLLWVYLVGAKLQRPFGTQPDPARFLLEF